MKKYLGREIMRLKMRGKYFSRFRPNGNGRGKMVGRGGKISPAGANIGILFIARVRMGDFSACASLANCKGGGELRKDDEGCNYISISKAAVTLSSRNNGGKITDGVTHEHSHLVREAPQYFENKRK